MKGFRLSTGDIMAWLNSDDLLLPDSLATVAAHFSQSDETQLIYGDTVMINARDQLLEIVEQIPVRFETLLYGGHIINQEAVFWKRELYEKVGGLNKTLHYALDYDLWVRMAQHTKPRYVSAILSAFRAHPAQKTSRMDCYTLEQQAVRQGVQRRLDEGKLAFAFKTQLWHTFLALRRQSRKLQRRRAAHRQRNQLARIPGRVAQLASFFGSAWLYGCSSDGWLGRAAALALKGGRQLRRLRMEYLTHGLPVEGALRVKGR